MGEVREAARESAAADPDRRIAVDVHLDTTVEEERADLRGAFVERPRRIPPRYFYDPRGSRLFEEITRLEEYYLTRAERALLERRAGEIVARAGCRELVELGSGAATKTRLLLDAMDAGGCLERYVPFDVDESIVRRTARELARRYPRLEIHGVVGDFTHHLEHLPPGEERLISFLGSTIGNFTPAEAIEFLGRVAAGLGAGDRFLLGYDLVKDEERIVAAYNDRQGVTAEFNRNVLAVLNERFGADFVPARFAHRAVFNRERSAIEMWLVSRECQRVEIPALDLAFELAEGEGLLTELSHKYRREDIEELLAAAGLAEVATWVEGGDLFALALARRA